MPNPGSDKALRKVTLNLYEEDCAYLEANMTGWSTWVRDIIHAEVRKAMNTGSYRYPLIQRKRTVGDLDV